MCHAHGGFSNNVVLKETPIFNTVLRVDSDYLRRLSNYIIWILSHKTLLNKVNKAAQIMSNSKCQCTLILISINAPGYTYKVSEEYLICVVNTFHHERENHVWNRLDMIGTKLPNHSKNNNNQQACNL